MDELLDKTNSLWTQIGRRSMHATHPSSLKYIKIEFIYKENRSLGSEECKVRWSVWKTRETRKLRFSLLNRQTKKM